jgi:hypothetical protein
MKWLNFLQTGRSYAACACLFILLLLMGHSYAAQLQSSVPLIETNTREQK